MTTVRMFAVGCMAAFAGLAASQEKKPEKQLPEAVVAALEKAESLEVYSLNGATNDPNNPGWHGTKVLGKTTVKGDAAKNLVAALKKVHDGEPRSDCFTPLHGIRAVSGGKNYDLLISFECRWMYVYAGEADKPQMVVVSEGPQDMFNKILTDAKVQLAK